jgi:hypothetical protein
MKYKARPHLAVRSDRSRNLLCHLGLHRWSTVPRWWLKIIDEQLGPVAVERTIEASEASWPGGVYGMPKCKPFCVRCGKGES